MAGRRAIAAMVVVAMLSGCSWLTRDKDETPEKLYSDKPCTTECCCKTKRGYYAYFRCLDRAACDQQGGSCERADVARCEAAQR